jgi:hypothetical protein
LSFHKDQSEYGGIWGFILSFSLLVTPLLPAKLWRLIVAVGVWCGSATSAPSQPLFSAAVDA